MNIPSLLVAVTLASRALAFDVESRFDSGLEGWTLEGPGTVEWVATPGTGGHLKVTRTGAGELYLVAPSAFHANWVGSRPRFTLNYRPTTNVAQRGISVEVQGPGGLVTSGSDRFGLYANTWSAIGCWWQASQQTVLQNVTRVRVRIGIDSSLPVGEVTFIDQIGVQSCAANCDGSTGTPALTANDFMCFMIGWASRDPKCNFDGQNGLVGGEDFQAFMDSYAAGCFGP